MTPTLKLGENIKRLREFRGYSQDYMAAQLDISQKTYSNIEADRGKVNKGQIEHIAEVLNVDPLYLLTYDHRIVFQNENCEQTGMFNTYNATSGKERELYEQRIKALEEEVLFLRSLVKKQP